MNKADKGFKIGQPVKNVRVLPFQVSVETLKLMTTLPDDQAKALHAALMDAYEKGRAAK